MLDVFVDDLEPIVLAPLPHRKIWAVDDIGVVERSERDGDHIGEVAAAVMYGRAALRAEMIGGRLAAVGGASPLLRCALDGDAFRGPARLDREGAAGALLAGKAVADRHAHRIAARDGAQLSAAAGGAVFGHFAAFLNARRTRASSEASVPSS